MPYRTGLRRTKVATQSLALASTLMCSSAGALAEPPPISLDRVLSNVLALSDANGCSTAFGLPDFDTQERHDEFLLGLNQSGQLGKELTAICGSSAVTSAAALGGSLGSLQTTKTVSQFRIARHRLDSRLDAQDKDKRSGSVRSILLAAAGDPVRPPISDASELLPAFEPGIGVFGQADYERRKRDASDLETGYKADIVGGVIGIDYATANGLVIGAWAGYQDTDANFRGSGFGAISPDLANALTPGLVNDMCNIGPGGGFDDRGGQFGAFAGARAGKAFADIAVQYSRRDYDYRRNVCAIKTPPIDQPIVRNPDGSFSVGGQLIDNIYAGKITGDTKHTEWSVSGRAGYDFGNERVLWGPRLSVTYLESKIDGFTESGRTSVTNTVTSNTPFLETTRASGDPTGLELTFDDQSRTSIQSELQLLAAYRIDTAFGVLVPRASASWIHEFKGERERIKVRMAQDLRAQPTRFSFTTDRLDKNKGVIALGLTAVMGRDVAADIEVAHLVGDDRFDSTTVRVQARWRF